MTTGDVAVEQAVSGSERAPVTRRDRPRVPLSTRLLGLATMLADRISPALGAKLAYRLWFRTVRPAEEPEAFAVLCRARYRELPVAGAPVAYYDWGSGPTVLLVHGWGSHAGRMTSFVDPLRSSGFRVVAVDLPGHGRSPGVRTDIFELRDALLAAGSELGPLAGVVTHSFGSMAYLAAARAGLSVPAAALISPVIPLELLLASFRNRMGLSGATMDRLGPRLEAFLGDAFYRGLLSEGPPRALVVHDRDDEEFAVSTARSTADGLPEARLVITDGLGHNRILQDPEVVEEARRFLAGPGRTPRR